MLRVLATSAKGEEYLHIEFTSVVRMNYDTLIEGKINTPDALYFDHDGTPVAPSVKEKHLPAIDSICASQAGVDAIQIKCTYCVTMAIVQKTLVKFLCARGNLNGDSVLTKFLRSYHCLSQAERINVEVNLGDCHLSLAEADTEEIRSTFQDASMVKAVNFSFLKAGKIVTGSVRFIVIGVVNFERSILQRFPFLYIIAGLHQLRFVCGDLLRSLLSNKYFMRKAIKQQDSGECDEYSQFVTVHDYPVSDTSTMSCRFSTPKNTTIVDFTEYIAYQRGLQLDEFQLSHCRELEYSFEYVDSMDT